MADILQGTYVLAGGNNITLHQDGNTVSIIGGAGGGGGGVTPAVSGSNGSFSFSTVTFGNLNGLSFYTSNGSFVGSYTVPTQTNQTIGLYASSQTTGQSSSSTIDARSLTFRGAGIVSVGLSGGEYIISATGGGGGAESNWHHLLGANTAGNTTASGSTVGFSGINLTFSGTNGSVINVSAPATSSLVGVGGITISSDGSTISVSNVGASPNFSAGTTSNNLGSVVFSNSNGVSFGLNGSTITASHNGLTSQSNQNITAANGGFAFQTLSFSNLNGISFGTSAGSAITASHNALTTARASNDAVGLNTAQSNVTWTVNSSGISLDARGYAGTDTTFNGANISGSITQNSNGIQLSMSVAAPGGGFQSAGFSTQGNTAGDTGFASQSIQFVGGNNITLSGATGAGGVTMTISGANAGGAQTGISGIEVSNTTYTSGTVTFRNANGISFGSSGVNGISASYTVPTITSFSAQDSATTLHPVARIAFSTGNNITLSLSTGASSVTVGVTHNLAGTSTGFAGNLLSASMTHNSSGLNISMDHPAWLTTAMQSNAVTLSNIRVSAGTTSNLLSAITFSNSNGITFGLDASTITASHNGLTSQSNQNVTAANGGFAFQTLSFSNLNGISFGTSVGSAITASHNALTSQSNQAWSGSNASSTFQTLSFNNANGASWSNNGGAVEVSYTRPVVSNAIQSVGSATNSGTNTSRFAADDHVHAGVFSMGVSNDAGNTAGDTRVDVGRFVLRGGNNITLSQITAANALNTIVLSAGAGGGVNPVASASNGSFSFTTLNFSNANNVTFGTSAGSIITASVAAPGAAAENNAINLLGANTAGNTTATGSTIGWSGINLTLSGTNNSIVNISAPPVSSLVGTSGISLSTNGSTISVGKVLQSTYVPYLAFSTNSQTLAALGATSASARFFPIFISDNIIFNALRVMHNLSYATSTVSGQQTITYGYGIFSNNAGTLSSISSSSLSLAVTNSSVSNTVSYPVSTGTGGYTYTTLTQSTTANIQSFWGTAAGGRPLDLQFGNTMSLSSGAYWLGVLLRHSSSSANIGISIALGGNANALHNSLAPWGVASSAQTTNSEYRIPYMGLGAYTVSQSTLPNGVPLTQIAHTQTIHPLVSFLST